MARLQILYTIKRERERGETADRYFNIATMALLQTEIKICRRKRNSSNETYEKALD
jgi:hypothetical protein